MLTYIFLKISKITYWYFGYVCCEVFKILAEVSSVSANFMSLLDELIDGKKNIVAILVSCCMLASKSTVRLLKLRLSVGRKRWADRNNIQLC